MHDEGFHGRYGGGELDGLCSDTLHVAEPVEEDKETKCEGESVCY